MPYPYSPYGFDPSDDGSDSTDPLQQLRIKNIFAQPTTPDDKMKRFLSGVNPPPKIGTQTTMPPPAASPISSPISPPAATPPTTPPPTPPVDNSDEGGKYFDAMRKMQTRGPAVSAYQDALKQQPTDDNVPVSMPRKIMGTLAGIAGGFAGGPRGGIEAANEIIDSPYKTAMRDYQTKMKNLGESAKLEQDDQTSQLNAMAKAREYGLKFNEYQQKVDKDKFDRGIEERKTTSGETTAAAASKRADTAAALAAEQSKGIDSEIAYRQGNLENERARTDIAGRQAGTAARQADTSAAAQADTAKYHAGELEIRRKNADTRAATGKVATTPQQAYAVDNALRELATDPRFKNYVTADNNKGTYNMTVDDGSLMYQEFKRRVKALAESGLKTGSPFDTNIDSPVTIGRPK